MPYPAWDLEAIGKIPGCTSCDTYVGSIYTGGSDGRPVRAVGGASGAAINKYYCRSGAYTFEKCSQQVIELYDDFCDQFGDCTPNVIRYTASDDKLSTTGDSGSPIYYYRSDSRLEIVAMHIGRIGSNMHAEKWQTIQASFDATIVTCC
jgi:hypothetical protein